MAKPASDNRYPAVLALSASGTNQGLPQCEVLLQANSNVNLRWHDDKGFQQTWKAISDANKWHVYGILPTKKGAKFYIKEGKEPLDPDNLPDMAFSIISGKMSGDMFCYILPGWEGSDGGNAIEVDWLQVGNPKNVNTFDFVAPDRDKSEDK